MIKKSLSLLLSLILLIVSFPEVNAFSESESDIGIQTFIHQLIFQRYALVYDTFNAAVMLDDGTEIKGIGFTDYSAYFEVDNSAGEEVKGYFASGFVADIGYELPKSVTENGLVIEDLDFTDNNYQFVYGYDTESYSQHCIKNGQYLIYGVDDKGAIFYSSSEYVPGVCDESRGALFSYDTGKYVFDPDVGNYIHINGSSLFDIIDFDQIETRINQIIADQDRTYSQQAIESEVYVAHEAIVSWLLSMQEESFLGYRVADLVAAAEKLDPMECIRITPDGLLVIQIENDQPESVDELTKWLVGAGCAIAVIGSTALTVFIPAARPFSGAITGAAIDVFMQVVKENKSLKNIQWEKVAVSAVTGAMMAWVCPLGASRVTSVVADRLKSETLGIIAGYGVLTFNNAIVSGTRELIINKIDGKEMNWDAFRHGAIMGAAASAVSAVLAEALSAIGPKAAEILAQSKVGQWMNKAAGKLDLFIRDKQVHLKNENLENILAPKSIHMAAKSAVQEINNQTNKLGGSYKELTGEGDGSVEKHEMISNGAYKASNALNSEKRGVLPAIKMTAEDHRLTASYGSSNAASAFRGKELKYILAGDMKKALQMNIDDITSKFGTKYNDAIDQMLDYASEMGWW